MDELARFEPGDPVTAATDFGGHVHAPPAAVVRPRTPAEVAGLVGLARARGLRVVARGQGHSTGGQALAAGGLVLDLSGMAAIRALDGDAVRVDAGLTWRSLVAATLPRGRAPPVLTDYLGLSVGGTLSVGGIGGESFRLGAQVDHVLELEIVTPAGELVVCSPAHEPALFDAARAGLGGAGIITGALVALTAAPRTVYTETLRARSVAEVLALIDQQDADHLHGDVRRMELHVTRARAVPGAKSWSYADFLARNDDYPRRVARRGHAHPWLDLFLPASIAARVVEQVSTRPYCAGRTELFLYPLRRSRCRAPRLRLPDEEKLVLFDVLGVVPSSEVARVVEDYGRIARAARELGATCYPIGSVPYPDCSFPSP